ncbi:MAG: zf-TFIIB domain-containing protein [Planctomycetota bacterium]
MQRLCPVCHLELQETQLYLQTVDRCSQCNGIYFDTGELESIVKIVDIFNHIHLSEDDIDPISAIEKKRILKCPQDQSIMIKEEIGEDIVIDLCEQCQGIWLDDHEITALKRIETHISNYLNLYIKLGS